MVAAGHRGHALATMHDDSTTKVVTLDVSDLEAPEPLLRARQALAHLPQGALLHMKHRLWPRLLCEQLPELGFDWETRQGAEGGCELFIWHRGDERAAALGRRMAAPLPPWRE